MMEHFHMALGFHVKGLFHRTSVDEYGHIAVQDIHFLLCITDHSSGCPDAAEGDNHTTYKKEAA